MARQRKTRDIFEVRGNYGYGHGFEAKARLREYRESEPGVPFKIVCTREKIEQG